jgi:hypothetical protein
MELLTSAGPNAETIAEPKVGHETRVGLIGVRIDP